jgi:hypothetical protein
MGDMCAGARRCRSFAAKVAPFTWPIGGALADTRYRRMLMIDAIFETLLELIDEAVFGTLGRMVAWVRTLGRSETASDAPCCD